MSAQKHSVSNNIGSLREKISAVVANGIQSDPIPGIGSREIQMVSWFALDVVGPYVKDETQVTSVAYKLLMPIALFLSQLAAMREEQRLVDVPLKEALVQAVSDSNAGIDQDIVSTVITSAVDKLGEMGYSVSHVTDMSLEEAEAVGRN